MYHIRDKNICSEILFQEPKGKKPVWGCRLNRNNNIKMDFIDSVHMWTGNIRLSIGFRYGFVHMVMDLRIPQNTENF